MTQKHKIQERERIAVVQRKSQQTVRTENEHEEIAPARGAFVTEVALALAKRTVALKPVDILALQRSAGNRAVQRMLNHQSKTSQPSAFASVIQRQTEEDEPVQRKLESKRRAANRTGLPDRLKAGVESLSGLSLDDVRVHYNSPRPAQIQARAYTQGIDIHLGPREEEHLPHEAWHVVQQKQGRVRQTIQAKGLPVNDDAGLEHEADVMGARAYEQRVEGVLPKAVSEPGIPAKVENFSAVIQGVFELRQVDESSAGITDLHYRYDSGIGGNARAGEHLHITVTFNQTISVWIPPTGRRRGRRERRTVSRTRHCYCRNLYNAYPNWRWDTRPPNDVRLVAEGHQDAALTWALPYHRRHNPPPLPPPPPQAAPNLADFPPLPARVPAPTA
jgi:hypothetical protein